MATQRFAFLLFGIFAGIALLLAGIGVYGVMAFAVAMGWHRQVSLEMLVRHRASLGEIVSRLRNIWGSYVERPVF